MSRGTGSGPPPRGVLLCADDYGMTDGISAGIGELAAIGRVNMLSAMVSLPAWSAAASELPTLRPHVSIGLHLVLTVGRPLASLPVSGATGAFPALPRLLRASLSGALDPAALEREIHAQLDAFETATGARPDHVDGHQHVHALPRVRRALLLALRQRYGPSHALLVRDPTCSVGATGEPRIKRAVVALAGRGTGAAIRAAGFAVNGRFAGYSALADERVPVAELAAAVARAARPGPLALVMCHPGHASADVLEWDSVTGRRDAELATLMADEPGGTIAAALHRFVRGADGLLDFGALDFGGTTPLGAAA